VGLRSPLVPFVRGCHTEGSVFARWIWTAVDLHKPGWANRSAATSGRRRDDPNLWLFERAKWQELLRAASSRQSGRLGPARGGTGTCRLKLRDRTSGDWLTAGPAPVRGCEYLGRRQPHLSAAHRRYRHGLEEDLWPWAFPAYDLTAASPLTCASSQPYERLRPEGFRHSDRNQSRLLRRGSWSRVEESPPSGGSMNSA